jgi:membrane protein DedA with SNARE-associated domain
VILALLGGLTSRAIDAVTAGGPLALALVMLTENLFPPIPSEAVLPLAGFLVQRGSMAFVPALAASTAGSVVGALLLYAIGRWGGRPVLLRWRRVLRLTEDQLDRADAWFDNHGPKLVFWCRMIPLARSVISVPAGASEMPIGRFVLLTTIGSLLWNTALISSGIVLGENWETVTSIVGTYSDMVLIGLAVTTLAAIAYLVYRSSSRRR